MNFHPMHEVNIYILEDFLYIYLPAALGNRSVGRYPDSMSIRVSSWWICSFMYTISHLSNYFNSTESTAILRASRCTPLVESNTTKSLPMQKKPLPMYKKSLPMYLVKIYILEDFLYIFRPAPLGGRICGE